LDRFDNSWYKPGSIVKRFLWTIVSMIFFQSPIPWPCVFKCALLKLFGTHLGAGKGIGRGIVIKPGVNIKYPWFVTIGNHSWIGEGVWLDSLGEIKIGANVCISQGAYIFTGNHDYKKEAFDLMVKPVVIEDGSWIGAKAVVCPGVTVATNSVLAAGSVATKDLEAGKVYQGNPAVEKRTREVE
ncbi:MAG: colanic acid biosynthesis acetyltransferase WcaF, partial [Candidatus Omnitrophica bacterium]|nr:colanic acid biosynthesis acetyltransferase WcaF [Candidatus Omnitrophota bacterium]